MKDTVKKSLDSFLSKEVKEVKQVKDLKGGGLGLGENCYIIVGGQRIYC